MNHLNRLKKELKTWKARFIALNNRSPTIEDIKSESDTEKKYCQYKMLKKRKETFKFIQTCKPTETHMYKTPGRDGVDKDSSSPNVKLENLGLEILVDESNTIEDLHDLTSGTSHDMSFSYDSFMPSSILDEAPSMDRLLTEIGDGKNQTEGSLWKDITNTRIQGRPTTCSESTSDYTINDDHFSYSADGLLNNPTSCTLTETLNSYLNEYPTYAHVTSVETILEDSIGLSGHGNTQDDSGRGLIFESRKSNRPEKTDSTTRQRTNKIKMDLRKGYRSKLSSKKEKLSKTATEYSTCTTGNFDEVAINICHTYEFLYNDDTKTFTSSIEPIFDLLNNREYSSANTNKNKKKGLIVQSPTNSDVQKILTTAMISKVNHSVNRILLKLYSKEDTKKISLYRAQTLFKRENTSNLEFLELNSFVSFGTQKYITETCKKNQTYLILFTTIENLLNFKLFYFNLYETIIKRSIFSIEEEIPVYLHEYIFHLNDFIYFSDSTRTINYNGSLTCSITKFSNEPSDIEVSAKFIGSEYLDETFRYLQQIRKTYLGPILISTTDNKEAEALSAYLRTERYPNETFLPMEKDNCYMCLNHFSTRDTWVANKTNSQTVIDFHKKAFKKKLIITTDGEHLKYFKGYSVLLKLGFPIDIKKFENMGITNLIILFNPTHYFNSINSEHSTFESQIVLKELFNGTKTKDMFVVENDFRFTQSKHLKAESLPRILNHLVEEQTLKLVCLDIIQFQLEILSDENIDDFISKIRSMSVFCNPHFKVDLTNATLVDYLGIIKEVGTLKAQRIIKLTNIRKGFIFKVNGKINIANIQESLEKEISATELKLKNTNDILFDMASSADKQTSSIMLSNMDLGMATHLTINQGGKSVPEIFKKFVSISMNKILKTEKEIKAIDVQLLVNQCVKKYPKLSRISIIKTIDNFYKEL